MFTPIIGKISEENPMFLTMKKSNVPNGKQRTLSKHMLMDANMSTDVSSLMDGKSKNTIHLIIRCMHAVKLNSVKNHIAPTTTQNLTEDSLLISSLRYSPKIEVQWYSRHKYISLYF